MRPRSADGYSVRTIHPEEADLFASRGETLPERCFVVQREGVPVGQVGFRSDLPPTGGEPLELTVFGLSLPWEGDHMVAGGALFGHALPLVGQAALPVDARVNLAMHDHPAERCRLFETVGFELFQEKTGFVWRPGPSLPAPTGRLQFRSVREEGEAAFAAALASGGAQTLDRNDRYYYEICGPQRWGREMMGYLEEADAANWKLAYDSDGALVGYVMLSAFDEPGVATITHIGVLPEHRGNGYVVDVLVEATASAERSGFREILSDVDVLNRPMRAAMERAGHREGLRDWHVWHYRWTPPPVRGTVTGAGSSP